MSGVWLRAWRSWVPGAVLCLVGLGLLGAYRLVLAEEAELGRGLLARRAQDLEALEGEAATLAQRLEEARATRDGLARFYDEKLSTERQMLTAVIAEVKQLAEQAGLAPSAIRYDQESLERQRMVQRTLDFAVTGTYSQVRTLVNFLELSDTFMVLERISLRGNADEDLGQVAINLRVAALFAADGVPSEGES